MTDHAPPTAVSPIRDDLAAAFQIEGWPVRGRLVRLGDTIDTILAATTTRSPSPPCWARPAPWRPWSAPA